MHLNECFDLAFSRPIADALEEDVIANPAPVNSNDYQESALLDLDNTSSTQSQQPQQNIVQGSVVSAIECIVSEWGTKALTNFYIPPEHHAGYSYLYEEQMTNSHHRHTQHSRSHLMEHHHPAFVYAEEFNNLHPHQSNYSIHGPKMTLTAMHSSLNNLTSLASSMHNELHHPQHTLPIPMALNANCIILNSAQMTVPYMHPHLEIAVPPLHLPLYFGALCFSFALGGIVMLCLPPKWVNCGGGRVSGEISEKEYTRHWFPYRSFAWILILCQSPCSFLADYIHMTNISQWHTVDRFLACILMSLELGKLIVMRPYTRPVIYLVNLLCCVVAIFCFLKSQNSQQRLNEDGFVFWHCGWHCYPLMCIIVRLVEEFSDRRWGEYCSFDECQVKRGEGGGTLLSTIAMNQQHGNTVEDMQQKNQTPTKPVKNRVMCHDREAATSGTTANDMPSPGLRRSRRIARQKPEVVQLSS